MIAVTSFTPPHFLTATLGTIRILNLRTARKANHWPEAGGRTRDGRSPGKQGGSDGIRDSGRRTDSTHPVQTHSLAPSPAMVVHERGESRQCQPAGHGGAVEKPKPSGFEAGGAT